MSNYDIGDVVTVTATFKVNDVLTDPTAIALTVKAPDGTTSTPTPTHAGTGTYTSNLLLSQAGTWWYRFVGTGTAAGAEEGFINVSVSNVV